MANTVIQIKGSGVTGNVPSTLQPGELAINYVDGKLFYGNESNTTTLFDVITEPSGLDGEIQFNDSGSFGATSDVRYDYMTGEFVATHARVAGQNLESVFIEIDSLQSDTSNLSSQKVNRAGDVMTGDLVLTQNVRANKIIANTEFFAGIATESATLLPNVIAQFTSNSTTYTQVNQQNIDEHGTSDYVLTADVGTDTDFYVDVGIINSQYDNQSPNNSLGTSAFPLDGYLIVQGSTINQVGGNLIIGTTSTSAPTELRIIVGGVFNENVVARFTSTGLNVAGHLISSTLNVGEITSPTTTRIYNQANSAFVKANLAYDYAQAAFDKANTGATATTSADYFPRGDYGYLTSSMYELTGFTAELIGPVYDMRVEPIIPLGYDLHVDLGYLT
jgi:hypothetical protein